MIILSFLGKGDYVQTIYEYNNNKYESRYFPHILTQIFPSYQLYVILTKEAKEKHGKELFKLCRFNEIEIPSGKSENEIWEIFDSIINTIPENEDIILDITHGFRSQPLIAVTSAIYLRTIKNIKIENILYGAYEAMKPDTKIAPVFDLKPLIDLIDWSNAVNEFIHNDNSSYLSKLLKQVQKNTYTRDESFKAENLKILGHTLQKVSTAGALSNTKECLEEISRIPDLVSKSLTEVENIPSAKPFVPLLNKIYNKYADLINIDESNLYSIEGLIAQNKLIKNFIETEKYQQAITLICELFISLFCLRNNLNPGDFEERKKGNALLGELIENFKINKEVSEELKDITVLWSNISTVRNQINHAGIKPNIINTNKLIVKIKEFSSKIENDVNIYISNKH